MVGLIEQKAVDSVVGLEPHSESCGLLLVGHNQTHIHHFDKGKPNMWKTILEFLGANYTHVSNIESASSTVLRLDGKDIWKKSHRDRHPRGTAYKKQKAHSH